jgi:hypothetical protein
MWPLCDRTRTGGGIILPVTVPLLGFRIWCHTLIRSRGLWSCSAVPAALMSRAPRAECCPRGGLLFLGAWFALVFRVFRCD